MPTTTPPSGTGPSALGKVVAIIICVVAITLYLAGRRSIDGLPQHIASIGLVAAMLLVAMWAGVSTTDLGVAPRDLRSGAMWGLAVGAAAAAVIVVTSLVPLAEGFFRDDRHADLPTGELLAEMLVRVPIATVLFEELIFRGVLLGLLMMVLGRLAAVATSSALFGLWHLLGASDFADSNDGFGSSSAMVVVAVTVLVTGLAGAGLGWLRLRSRSVLAPTLVHTAINSTALLVTASMS